MSFVSPPAALAHSHRSPFPWIVVSSICGQLDPRFFGREAKEPDKWWIGRERETFVRSPALETQVVIGRPVAKRNVALSAHFECTGAVAQVAMQARGQSGGGREGGDGVGLGRANLDDHHAGGR